MKKNDQNYMSSYEKIKEIIHNLETNKLSNKEALIEFKKAYEYFNKCEKDLKEAKSKIVELTEINE